MKFEYVMHQREKNRADIVQRKKRWKIEDKIAKADIHNYHTSGTEWIRCEQKKAFREVNKKINKNI